MVTLAFIASDISEPMDDAAVNTAALKNIGVDDRRTREWKEAR